MSKENELISLLQAAKERPVSAETLRRAVIAVPQKLKAKKIGQVWVTTLKDVDKYLTAHPPVVGRPPKTREGD